MLDNITNLVSVGANVPLPAAAAPTLSTAVSGAQGARTDYFKITLVNAQGESLPSAEASVAVAANSVGVVTAPTAVANPGATGYNVYGSTTSGAEVKQNASPIAMGVNWQEPATGFIAGAAPPTADSTAPTVTIPVPSGTGVFEVGVSASYSAVSAVSGVVANFLISQDGVNFVQPAQFERAMALPSGAANQLVKSSRSFDILGPRKEDNIFISAFKVTLANTDTANAATVALLSEARINVGS